MLLKCWVAGKWLVSKAYSRAHIPNSYCIVNEMKMRAIEMNKARGMEGFNSEDYNKNNSFSPVVCFTMIKLQSSFAERSGWGNEALWLSICLFKWVARAPWLSWAAKTTFSSWKGKQSKDCNTLYRYGWNWQKVSLNQLKWRMKNAACISKATAQWPCYVDDQLIYTIPKKISKGWESLNHERITKVKVISKYRT